MIWSWARNLLIDLRFSITDLVVPVITNVRIEAKHELLRRMLSYPRVSFETTDGPMEVLIEEMQEMNADGLVPREGRLWSTSLKWHQV
jgi:hypothetical protein